MIKTKHSFTLLKGIYYTCDDCGKITRKCLRAVHQCKSFAERRRTPHKTYSNSQVEYLAESGGTE